MFSKQFFTPELLTPNTKPKGPVEIDWASPITDGLVFAHIANDYAGLPVDLVSGKRPAYAVGSGSSPILQDGTRVLNLDGSTVLDYGRTGADEVTTYTIIARARNPFNSTNGCLFSSGENENGFGFKLNMDDTSLVLNGIFQGGDNDNRLTSDFDELGINSELRWHTVGGSANGITERLWARGVEVKNASSIFIPTAHAGRSTKLGGNRTNGEIFNGYISWVYIWARELTPSEHWEVYNNIYARTLRPKGYRLVFLPSVGGGPQILTPSSITSAEAVGAHTLSPGAVALQPSAINSDEAIGAHSLLPGAVLVQPSAIGSDEAVGNHTLTPGQVSIQPNAIGGGEAFGVATITGGVITLQPSGIVSAEVFGAHQLIASGVLLPSSIASAEAFGVLTIQPGAVVIEVPGIASQEAHGTQTVQPGSIIIAPNSLASVEGFGDAVVLLGTSVISPASIASDEQFGSVVIVGGAVFLNRLIGELSVQPQLGASMVVDTELTGEFTVNK